MDKLEIVGAFRSAIEDYLNNHNLDLVDLIYRHEGSDLVLRILVDKPEGGITVGECAQLNIKIGAMLDEKNILEQSYTLEVSSPGLDRSLQTKKDFARCLNKEVKFFLKEPINDRIELDGVITKVDEEVVSIDIKGNVVQIPISNINRAKQII
jgi:ribosome maturation factor RimP